MAMDIDKAIKRQELIEEYRGSDACALFKRIKVFELAYRVFLANYEEWQQSIDTKCPEDPMQVVRMMQDRSWVEPYLVEATRTLHNFVASAFTLVDNTRVLYRELYEPNGLIPDYQSQIDERFIKDGVSQFVKDLRQFCQHYRLPLVTARLGFNLDKQGGEIQWGVPILKRQLLVFSGWSARAKAFLNDLGKEIDLEGIVGQYRDKVVNFHEWFEGQQRDVHKAEWDYREAISQRIRELSESEDTPEESSDPPL